MTGKIIQKPLVCRNAHCGASCSPIIAEQFTGLSQKDITKCPYYERRDDLYMKNHTNIEREKIDNAIEEIQGEYSGNKDWCNGLNRALEILKKHIGG